MKRPIYLDYAATAPLDPRVLDAMLPFLRDPAYMGNAASTHVFGQKAREAVDQARQEVAHLIHACPQEIIWTSGATEANNLALKGVTSLYPSKGKHIITMKTEHPSILDCCQYLEKQGFWVTYLAPEKNGLLDLAKLKAAFRDDTVLVSVMHVNNETGVIQDIEAIAEVTKAHDTFLHVDAAQSVGKIPINMEKTAVDLMSLCAHKVYGPKGVGALYVRRKPRVRVATQIHGGGHEQGMRSGTLPVHQLVGMGAACSIAGKEMLTEFSRTAELRERFLQGLARLKNISTDHDRAPGYPGIVSIHFRGPAEDAIKALPELSFSTGTACHAKKTTASHVLRALGLTEEAARSVARVSFGRFTTEQEIDFAIHVLSRG